MHSGKGGAGGGRRKDERKRDDVRRRSFEQNNLTGEQDAALGEKPKSSMSVPPNVGLDGHVSTNAHDTEASRGASVEANTGNRTSSLVSAKDESNLGESANAPETSVSGGTGRSSRFGSNVDSLLNEARTSGSVQFEEADRMSTAKVSVVMAAAGSDDQASGSEPNPGSDVKTAAGYLNERADNLQKPPVISRNGPEGLGLPTSKGGLRELGEWPESPYNSPNDASNSPPEMQSNENEAKKELEEEEDPSGKKVIAGELSSTNFTNYDTGADAGANVNEESDDVNDDNVVEVEEAQAGEAEEDTADEEPAEPEDEEPAEPADEEPAVDVEAVSEMTDVSYNLNRNCHRSLFDEFALLTFG